MANSDDWVAIRNTLTGGVTKVHKQSLPIWLEKEVIELVEDEEDPEPKPTVPDTYSNTYSGSSTAEDEAATVDDENSGE